MIMLITHYQMLFSLFFFFFFKQKTAYEMRISDWSSDVCSSDLANPVNELDMRVALITNQIAGVEPAIAGLENIAQQFRVRTFLIGVEIGRASCRERVCQYV